MIEYKAVSGPQTTKQNKKIRNRKGIYLYYDNNSMDIFFLFIKTKQNIKIVIGWLFAQNINYFFRSFWHLANRKHLFTTARCSQTMEMF